MQPPLPEVSRPSNSATTLSLRLDVRLKFQKLELQHQKLLLKALRLSFSS